MPYTVKALAKLSGVTDKTLRYYDSIGLLKPAYVNDNNYRYYEKEQLIKLQQILFFREMGIALKQIKWILHADDYDKISALVENKRVLEKKIENYKELIRTIENTVSHLRGEIMMKDKDLYKGFDSTKQKEYENYLVKRGVSRHTIDESWEKFSNISKSDRDKLHEQGITITEKLKKAIDDGFLADSSEVQQLIKKHYDWICHYWIPTKESYIGLSQMYKENNEFNRFYSNYHPNMVSFLSEAMTVFANDNLS